MKKLFLFFGIVTLFGCSCWPQIPTQYIQADQNCEAYLPDYTVYVHVRTNCNEAIPVQEPLPGTKLDAGNPAVEVILTATNAFGTDVEKFGVYLWDPPQIIWDSIPGDTIAYRMNDIDLLIESVEKYRAYLGISDTNTVTLKTLKIHY